MTETKVGVINKISGPVVQASNMLGTKLYDVVRVGNEKLVGEIIRLEGSIATIQVYESTDGLTPGEPVYPTNSPLSVELGPGLLRQIYDGIQRPLPEIQKMTGDNISRGIDVPGLDHKKLWDFRPILKKGDKVVGGDILGSIPETPTVDFKLLVPPYIKGTLEYIAPAGDYTIDETAATVLTPNGEKIDLQFYHKWPVRIPRPIHKRLPSTIPLITGQRIFDTFAPIAKGGTGAIPGGFGTGKCVTPDTPVLLENGDRPRIDELYAQLSSKGEIIEDNETETLIKLDEPISIISFDGTNYVSKQATHIYKGFSPIMLQITTRSGRSVKITPQHKLFKFTGSKIEETRAIDLKVGDFLVVPRKITTSVESEVTFDPYTIDDSLRVADPLALKEMKEILTELKKEIPLNILSKELKLSYDVLMGYWLEKNKPSLNFLKRLTQFAKRKQISVSYVKSERQSEPFRVPNKMSKELAEWLGLFVADGHIKGEYGGIYLYNKSEEILNRFAELTELVFDISPSFGTDGLDRTPYMVVRNISLAKFLYYLGIPKENKTRDVRIPSSVMRCNDEIRAAFLAGYFAGDGSFSRYSVQFTTISKGLHSDIGYLLSFFGIIYRSRRKGNSHIIEVDGLNAELLAEKFIEYEVFHYSKLKSLFTYAKNQTTHFTSTNVIPISNDLLQKIKSTGFDTEGHDALRKYAGIRLSNYLDRKYTPTVSTVERIYQALKRYSPEVDKDSLRTIQCLLEASEEVFFDNIVSIELIDKETVVYDLTVEETHNFVGGDLPFTLHNTVSQHQLAKWSDAKIVVYVGCGERGNEMTDVLREFPKLVDPYTGGPLMDRTTLIANTSNMPVAAREASVYTGITLAEFFRDMGYDVAMMADSTSRWAEALREISGRLEEMPGEEGFPAYLASKVAQYYERAGRVLTLGSEPRTASITVVGAVSPPGGDFSEPVTQNTLRIVKVFWALSKDLAARRHFPAIDYLLSYTLYWSALEDWYATNIDPEFPELRAEAMALLQKDKELSEIVSLVGPDALPPREKIVLEIARMLKESFLQQNAFHEVDSFCSLQKQYLMLKAILSFYKKAIDLYQRGADVKDIFEHETTVRITRMKYIEQEQVEEQINALISEIDGISPVDVGVEDLI